MLRKKLELVIKYLALGLIYIYRVALSPIFGGRCRFSPSCSEYAVEAFSIHSPFRAFYLTTKRLAKCHPLGSQGYDPVPHLESK